MPKYVPKLWLGGGEELWDTLYNKDHIFAIKVKHHLLYIIDLFGFAFWM